MEKYGHTGILDSDFLFHHMKSAGGSNSHHGRWMQRSNCPRFSRVIFLKITLAVESNDRWIRSNGQCNFQKKDKKVQFKKKTEKHSRNHNYWMQHTTTMIESWSLVHVKRTGENPHSKFFCIYTIKKAFGSKLQKKKWRILVFIMLYSLASFLVKILGPIL